MSNNILTEDQRQLIALAAIASTDSSNCSTEDQWGRAVIKRANTIAKLGLLQPNRTLMNSLDSAKLLVRIKKVEYIPKTKRYEITFVSETGNENGKVETIRTPISDSQDGKLIEPDIKRLEKMAGSNKRVLMFKRNEQPSEEMREKLRKEGKTVPPAGYRTAVWFEFID